MRQNGQGRGTSCRFVIERFPIINVTLTLLPTSESLACSASTVMVLLIELFK